MMPRVILAIVGVALTTLSTNSGAQSQSGGRRSATQPLSPVSMVSWVTEDGSGGTRLDVAVIWRGAREWFAHPERSSAGGTPGRFHSSSTFGDVTIEFTLLSSPRRIELLSAQRALDDNNVVLVDGITAAGGGRPSVRFLRVDPDFSSGRIETVLKTSPEVVAFIGCDVPASSPARQAMFDNICVRFKR